MARRVLLYTNSAGNGRGTQQNGQKYRWRLDGRSSGSQHEAIFLSTFVLITQNRMSARSPRRADLDLQVSLLTEHEVTQLITLVKAIAEHLHLQAAGEPELAELERDVAPEHVLDVIEKHEHDSTPG
jgi:uncharacterized membrane protein